MKIRGLFKKAAATLMAAVTALSILPATTAFAAGDIGTISFSHTYDSSGNAMRYNSSATFDGHTAGGTGNYKYRMFVDGENAFCIQPGVPLKTGNTLKQASSDTWNALSANQKKAVGLALLYGYQGNRSNLTGSDDEKWVATQTLASYFSKVLRNHYTDKLKGLTVENRIIHKKMIAELYALTPVIMKSDEGYWKNKISLDEYERLLKENLIKKYNEFTNQKLDENFELYTHIKFINKKPIANLYKGKIKLLGDKISIKIADNSTAQELAYFALGSGLATSNSRGFGFCNYVPM